MRSKRFQILAERPVNRETFIKPWPEVGLVAMNSPCAGEGRRGPAGA